MKWRIRSFLPRTLYFVVFLTCWGAVAEPARTQSYPTTSTPAPAWGGYSVPERVPYQPAMSTDVEYDASPVVLDGPTKQTVPPSSPWQPLETSPAPPALGGAAPPPMYDADVRLAEAPSLPADSPLVLTEQDAAATKSLIPPGSRPGMFQKIKFSATYLPQLENDSLGFSDLRASAVFGLPFFTRETPLVIEPEYRIRYLEGAAGLNLPPRLHNTSVEFRHFRRLSDCWIYDGAVTFGVFADDHNFDASDAFRITGRALLVYEQTDAWKWIAGVAYLNRAGATVLPVAGVAYRTDTVQYDLVFPRPRAAWALPGSIKDVDEQWLYVMGEFGGGVWAITRPATGTPDTLTMRDFRILFGYERKIIGGLSSNFEFGYVFARELEFDSGAPDITLDDTLLVRAGFSY